ncbi:MAG: aminopeptidase P family protein [Anaerovoracaceae bacterium]
MRTQLLALREKMKEQNIDIYIIPTTDYHGSEYVNEFFTCRKYISGFTGSAGTLIVTLTDAGLWTDGRYFLQAKDQLANSGIDLYKMGNSGVPTILEYLDIKLCQNDVLGFDGRVLSAALGQDIQDIALSKDVKILHNVDLVGDVWPDRPAINPAPIYALPDSVTGETASDKLSRIRTEMESFGATYHLLTSLEDIAWLFNLRGSDIEHSPVFFAYALISLDSVKLYVNKEALGHAPLPDSVSICNYDDIFFDLENLDSSQSIILDENSVNYSLLMKLPPDLLVINSKNPSEFMKSIKTSSEISHTKAIHVKDGVAMVNFLYWLKSNVGQIPMTEISVCDYLYKCRREDEAFFDLSFDTIAGYGENGAIIHYNPKECQSSNIGMDSFLLVDSGGHYNYGTTDITRTISLGHLTKKMKSDYTTVLKCNIALASCKFREGTSGLALDSIARQPLHRCGYDYNHGTGHGVGFMLSVHEGPNTISPRSASSYFYPSMITSNEPGLYLEGEYGIRLENEILSVPSESNEFGSFLEFETITYCPFDRNAIVPSLLTPSELSWLNCYHQTVYDTLSEYLDSAQKAWLFAETRPL